ncbi:HutD family protein [Asaia sp. VD9]|uniref:HutD/Ves family protein n=1 Tax=Asaia sp. VD9 TaxID=3081235 RepID=UPI0030170065
MIPPSLNLATLPAEPWRNGGGVTRVIARGAGWRLSLAEIAKDGAFSLFPGMTRSLALTGDDALDLIPAGGLPILLRGCGATAQFAGGEPIEAKCHGKILSVINLMVTQATGPTGRGSSGFICHGARFDTPAEGESWLFPLTGTWQLDAVSTGSASADGEAPPPNPAPRVETRLLRPGETLRCTASLSVTPAPEFAPHDTVATGKIVLARIRPPAPLCLCIALPASVPSDGARHV